MTTKDRYTQIPDPYSWEVPSAGDARFTTNTQRVEQRGILVPIVEALMRVSVSGAA